MLDAAVAEFLAHGYEHATLAAIAARAGVSTATVFKHFHAKADIFGAVMARVFGNDAARHEVPRPTPGDPRAGLLAIGRDYAATLAPADTRALFRVMIAEVPRFPELGRELYEQGKRPYLNRLHAYLRSEAGAGTLRIPDVPLAARQFLGMINDVTFWPHMLVVDLAEADAEAVVAAAVDTFLRGYSTAR
ncbi:TetR/AcrR family transcriptional regulator C-terminal domain-containing protein [Paracraurococcus ruber]|uniref:TetR/AcrR family transcriptional regulator C-terminal domain-containing protein n=1 Tax=Paracraurococcus ruber TaxID=77675 RepID=UPI0013053C44|nr:TetR/AcrR family transcriptional regulator C-terminal domain-containing protein [Paracraurococcus ruber]